jgi:cyanate lyase
MVKMTSCGIQKVASVSAPYNQLPPICITLHEAKAKKKMTFEEIGKALGRDEVWVAAVFYGQVSWISG